MKPRPKNVIGYINKLEWSESMICVQNGIKSEFQVISILENKFKQTFSNVLQISHLTISQHISRKNRRFHHLMKFKISLILFHNVSNFSNFFPQLITKYSKLIQKRVQILKKPHNPKFIINSNDNVIQQSK